MITVIDVCRDIRIEPDPRLTWCVGAAVRRIYEERFGQLPEKALRPKTAGGGSHCFAVYPDELRGDIEGVIRAHAAEVQRQGSLF